MDIKDIVERESEDPTPPQLPKPTTKTFTKKWVPRRRPAVLDPEASKTPRAAAAAAGAPHIVRPTTSSSGPSSSSNAGSANTSGHPLSDAERIHLENIRKIQQMGPEEIEREREEIFRSMDPGVLQSLLRRAELKEAENKGAQAPKPQAPKPGSLREPGVPTYGTRAPASGSMADWDPAPDLHKPVDAPTAAPAPAAAAAAASAAAPTEEEEEPKSIPEHVHPDDNTVHFPPPPEDLKKYFPDLPVETEKLAWMQPIDDSEEAEYSSELASVAPSELRFDFKGNLVTPRQSRQISTKAGLHHHGDAPSAAGYTLPELAHLSRSSHPAQRSMAIQTAGRVLHKLRLRKFARSSDLQEGLEALVATTRIMDSLTEAADESTRSLTVRTLATEALWLANTDNHKTKQNTEEPNQSE